MRPNTAQDIWRFIKKGPKHTCWLYAGGTFSGRYGRFSFKGKALLAHRHIYEISRGAVPDNLMVMHKCNNKLCCNPDHLTLGTNSDNQRHASASGAWKVGQTGIQGVTFDKSRKYWVASGYEMGKRKNLYTGPHKAKAILARKKWEKEKLVRFN